MFNFSHGITWIFILEVLFFIGLYFYSRRILIPNYYGNRDKEVEKKNIDEANRDLLIFIISASLYIILEYLGFKVFLLHIAAAVVFMMFLRNLIRPFVLKRFGRMDYKPEEVTDSSLIEVLEKLKSDPRNVYNKGKVKNLIDYDGFSYRFTSTKFYKRIPRTVPSSKSEFWAGFFAVLIWAFLVLNLVYILKVEMGAPEIMVTLLAFLIAYVLSPFYPDLYTTFVFAQDEEIGFDKFISVIIDGKEYFGSIKKLTFFKIALMNNYNGTLITIFHKKFLSGIMESFPEGRYISRDYVVSSIGQDKLEKKLSEWIGILNSDIGDSFETPIITFFDHNYGYGVKLRVKVKVDDLDKYGSLKDQLISLISQKAKEEKIDLRTPVLEVSMQEESSKVEKTEVSQSFENYVSVKK